jgi:hypothetical protein
MEKTEYGPAIYNFWIIVAFVVGIHLRYERIKGGMLTVNI